MRVLSLFDGMSCGQIALNRIGIKPETYYASEVDKHAIKVTMANYPDTVQLGDVAKWREWNIDWASIDLLIGGSPCQGFSFAGKQLAFDDPRSKLFFVYVDILNHIRSVNPGVKFMLENVKMKKEYMDVISEYLGVQPVFINSALVSAQNRQRYYWANWLIEPPEDKGIYLSGVTAAKPVTDLHQKVGDGEIITAQKFNKESQSLGRMLHNFCNHNEKAGCLTAAMFKGMAANGMTNIFDGECLRNLTAVECERLQTVPEGYTSSVSNTQRYKMLGNGWTIDVIAHIFKSMLV